MLSRLRRSMLRSPRRLLLLALGIVGQQGIAGSLSWCLHAGETPHVVGAATPCHGEAGAASDPFHHGHHHRHAGHGHHGHHGDQGQHGEDAHHAHDGDHETGPSLHVGAAGDLGSPKSPSSGSVAASAVLLSAALGPLRTPAELALELPQRVRAAPDDGRPRIAAALAGHSIRLLI